MKIGFKHGLISFASVGGIQQFLQLNSGKVTLSADNSDIVYTMCHYNHDYLIVETKNIPNAWTVNVSIPTWLGIELDLISGERTFITTTLEPIVGNSEPVGVGVGQYWFDRISRTMKKWNGTTFVSTITLFIAKIQSNLIYGMVSDYEFSGSTVNIWESGKAGYILLDEVSKPIRRVDGTFLTTDSVMSSTVHKSSYIKVGTSGFVAVSEHNIPAYTVVELLDNGRIRPASYVVLGVKIVGIIENDVTVGESVRVCVEGYFDNNGWNWSRPNAPVYINDDGVLTEQPSPNNSIIAYAITPKSLILNNRSFIKPIAGQKGEKGNTGSVGLTGNAGSMVVNSIKTLPVSPNVNVCYLVKGYHDGTSIGGGIFTWSPDTPRNMHDGGMIFSPDAIHSWNGSPEDIATLLEWTTSSDLTGCFIRILDVDVITPTYYGATGDGVHDDSAPFQSCLNKHKTMFVPPTDMYYILGNVIVPSGTTIYGFSRRPYNPNQISDVTGKGSVIVQKPGTTSMFRFSDGVTLQGLVCFGLGKTMNDFYQTVMGQLISQSTVTDCGIYNFKVGFGNNVHYIGMPRVTNCNIAQNDMGIRGAVDGIFTSNYINANRIGIRLPSGANDNQFLGNKIEWNDHEGVSMDGCNDNQFIGGIIDRNGFSGIRSNGCKYELSGVSFQRNGRNNLGSEECCHIYNHGIDNELLCTNIKTKTGRNDDGTGDLTPSYCVTFGGNDASQLAQISSSDLSGYVQQPVRYIHTPTELSITNSNSVVDIVNHGYSQKRDGKSFVSRKNPVNINPGEYQEFTLAVPPIVAYSRRLVYLDIICRNANVGSTISGRLAYHLIREAGNASLVLAGTVFTSGSTDVGTNNTFKMQVSVTDVTIDGSGLTFRVYNNHSQIWAPTVDLV